MLFGLIARCGTFAINAGLVFVLSQQVPALDLWSTQPKSTVLENARNSILAGLDRVRADLEANGKLLFSNKQTASAEPLEGLSPIPVLDRRTLRTRLVTN